MIKIEIHILGGCLEIEIKKNRDFYSLLVIISKSETFKEKGRAWSGKINDLEKLTDLADLVKKCHQSPSLPIAFTINDGRLIKVKLKEDSADISLELIHKYAEDHNESRLTEKIFGLVNSNIQDENLEKYTSIFGHF